MENTGDSQAKIRWRKVAAALPEATDPTACIVVLPGAESYKPKGKDDGGDPKRALRIAFAKTGRLTQFIEPEDSKDSPEIRARASPSATSCASSVSYPNRHAIRAASIPRSRR
ncbi:MAG: hypothetical protein ACLR9M_07495 [Eggerthella lenta]